MLSFTLWSLGIATLVATLSPVLASPITTQVPTPRGTFPHTNVFEVPPGSRIKHVGTAIHVFASDGTIVGVVPAAAPASSFPTWTPKPTTDAAASFQTGWITFAYWLNPDQGGSKNEILDPCRKRLKMRPPTSAWGPEFRFWIPLDPDWNNQPAPAPVGSFAATYRGQTVFLFNAIEPATSSTIVQPVLQYGPSNAGGGGYWTVANWYVFNGNAFFTSPVRVSVGQTLHGKIQLLYYLIQFVPACDL
ncbi:hypothetical protein GGX14DRAFT_600785 [Mycena pura]|uniref:Concanavalin A-like lectin/glucanase n=1 Tax=Mycena pura TaxID=153505 RepID=A0AAD6UQ63_9AGAR|nr:hypothetical protein GGX14DRAFT_600785 [Mycena pura]